MSFVPRDVLQMALSFLPTGDLAIASQTCAAWFLMADPWVFLEHYGWVPLGPLSRARSVKLRLAAADAEVVADVFSTLQHKCVSLQLEFVGGVPTWATPTPNSSVAAVGGGGGSPFEVALAARHAAAHATPTRAASGGAFTAAGALSPDRSGGAGTPPTGVSPMSATSVVALRSLVQIEILRPALQDLTAVANLCRPLVPPGRRLRELILNRACFAATTSPQAAAALDGFPAQRLGLVRVNTLLPRAVRLLMDQAGFPTIRMDRCVVLSQSDAPFNRGNGTGGSFAFAGTQQQHTFHSNESFAHGLAQPSSFGPYHHHPSAPVHGRQESSHDEEEDDVTLLVSGLVRPFDLGARPPVTALPAVVPDSRPLYATWQPPPLPAVTAPALPDGGIESSTASAALSLFVPDHAVATSIKPLRPTAAMPFPAQRLRRAFRQLVARGRGGSGGTRHSRFDAIRRGSNGGGEGGFGHGGASDDDYNHLSRSGFASVTPSGEDMTTSVSDLGISMDFMNSTGAVPLPFTASAPVFALSFQQPTPSLLGPPHHFGATMHSASTPSGMAAQLPVWGFAAVAASAPVAPAGAQPMPPNFAQAMQQQLLRAASPQPEAASGRAGAGGRWANGGCAQHDATEPCLQCLVHERFCPLHSLALLPPARAGTGFPCR
jgi:hypothetical protein